MNDSYQRSVNGALSAGASSVTFDSPARSLISGEGVKFAGHSTEYVITSPTATTFTVTPALTSSVADNEKITRLDPYRLVEFDEILDEHGSLPYNDEQAAYLYRLSLRARAYLEERTETLFKSRSVSELHSIDSYCQDTLILKYRPIVSVESITYQYIGDATATTIDADTYSVDTELGTIYYPYFPKGQNHLTVTYTGGDSVVSLSDQQNFLQLFQFLYALTPKGKDAMTKSGDSKLDLTFRTLQEVDEWIDKTFPQRRVRI